MKLKTEPMAAEVALQFFQADLEQALGDALRLPDEQHIDPRWSQALTHLRTYSARPAKRVRPTLVAAGWAVAAGGFAGGVPTPILKFAAGLELLHTFMLVHDDVADRALTRRGGPALHRLLGEGKIGEDLAVVLGDHLYARAIEVMMTCGAPRALDATTMMLGVCRHTAAGQYLDLDVGRTSLDEVTLFQTLKIAHLKTAKYGFVAPLVTGAMLGGGSRELLQALERVGRHAGLAFQLRDDLLGLFGDDSLSGKDGGGDFFEGKRTFPLIAALARATPQGRATLASLWNAPVRTQESLLVARAEIEAQGGRAATERVIERHTRAARRALSAVRVDHGTQALLDGLLSRLVRRSS